jgi:hypothetical protein
MLSSAKEKVFIHSMKKRPEDDSMYLRSCGRNSPKKTAWLYHGVIY